MNTYIFRPGARRRWPGRAAALLACLLLAALLLPAGWTVYAAQEAPPDRLPYDSPFDLLHLPGVATQRATGPARMAPAAMDWSRLVFQSARNERDWEIYAARGDGSDQINISNHGSMDIHPRLNRGATRVVFASNRHGTYDLFVMNADGGGPTRIVDSPGDDVFPAWSPDGGRIAFQAFRDGQPEIYAANADGSGQTRLTNHDDYDGQPAWSPDGSQVAFVRRESGGYRIWAMNADGSNLRQLSNQAYSADPAWSPDGSQIAYDADGNGDGWQEIWLVNADGSNQRQVYDPSESNTDAWVGSWSPDGRYLAFTRISFVNYQGQWYWTYAFLDAWDSEQPWNTVRLSYDGADWNPAWASTDGHAPESRALALPPQSPATFTVFWTGDDTGGSGLKDLDVQIREGAGGNWADWQTNTTATSASFTGVGGRAYYFRTRGRDHASNVEAWPATHDAMTTVEPNPPQTAVEALPAYSRNGLLVRWGGSDPGGSGIQSYDVQVRQGGSGAWTDWRMGVTETSAPFTGTAGLEYRFRARARDRAQNVEAWPTRADATTTLYIWGISGNVTDNRGAPVAGMTISASPAAFHSALSDRDGAYAAHVATEAASYSASWSKSGYGVLPGTAFPPNPDATFDVVLPPADNVVQNWGFEQDLSPTWQVGGDVLPVQSADARHTGQHGASLGWNLTPPAAVTIPNAPDGPNSFWDTLGDAGGNLHVAFATSDRLGYARRAADGAWSGSILGNTPGSNSARLAAGKNGIVYAVWTEYSTDIYFRERLPDGQWSTQVNVSNTPASNSDLPWIGTDSNGGVSVIWQEHDDPDPSYLVYSLRNTSGTWSTPGPIPGAETNQPATAVVSGEAVNVVWARYESSTGNYLYLSQRGLNGTWMQPERLWSAATGESVYLLADTDRALHLIWLDWIEGTLYLRYANRSPAGAWSSPETVVAAEGGAGRRALAKDRFGTIHVVINEDDAIRYLRREAGSVWSAVELVAETPELAGDIQLSVDSNGTAHAAWHDSGGTHLAHRAIRSGWYAPSAFPNQAGDGGGQLRLTVDGHNRAHVLWIDVTDSSSIHHALYETGNARLWQQLTIPASMVNPGLSFLYQLQQEYPDGRNPFSVSIQDALGVRTVFTATDVTTAPLHRWIDLTPWRGSGITVTFAMQHAGDNAPTRLYLGEVTTGSSYPDIWVNQPAWQAALPGRTFETAVTYGNRGGVAASGGQVTLQLPAELSFVSADPPPSATTPTLRWDVGALPAQSEPHTIRVMLQVAASAAGGSTVSATTRITASATELEQANNTAQGAIYIGSVRYLPVIMR